MKFLVDFSLDGYETEAEHRQACLEFIYDQLNMTASCVEIQSLTEKQAKILEILELEEDL